MTTLIGGRSCRTCRHSHRPDTGAALYCVRYPPQVFVVPSPQGLVINSAYPSCNPDVPCGEYDRSDVLASTEIGAMGRA